MSFFIQKQLSTVPRFGEDYVPGAGEYSAAVWNDIWANNPSAGLVRSGELDAAMYGVMAHDAYIPPPSAPLPEEEQVRLFAEYGLEKDLKPHKDYTKEAVDILVERKRNELRRRDIRGRAPWSMAPLGAGVGFLAALLDPLNIASGFVPVVGEARLMRMLGQANGSLGRAGVRARVGALEGLVGGIATEPLVAMGRLTEQGDYTMSDAVTNIAFNAAFSSAFRSGGGALGDSWRTRNGRPQPWETHVFYDSSLTNTERTAFRENLRNAHPALSDEEAGAAAALFDARARTWGRDMQIHPSEYYERYAPEFMRGEYDELLEADLLQAAKKTIYSDNRSVKMTFKETGVEPSLAERSEFRAYIESLDRQEVRSLKLEDPDAYMSLIRSVARKFFSNKDGLRFRREGKVVDYEHFAGRDVTRDEYVHTLMSTLKDADIIVEFTAAEGDAKAYFIKRYFDPDIQKDIWDMLVIRDNELKTKIARKAHRGRGTIESTVLRAGDEASQPATTGGATESASTPRGEYESTISKETPQVKDGGELEQASLAGELPRASIRFAEDGKAVVRFLQSADITSAPHEIFHIFRRELAETAALKNAPDSVRHDWVLIEKQYGVEPGKAWSRVQEENFANAGLSYLSTGKAPTPELAGVFARFRQWFIALWRGTREEIAEVSPAMREVFDRMVNASEAEDLALHHITRTLRNDPALARQAQAYNELSPESKIAVFRVAVAQAREGRPIDIEALVRQDHQGVLKAAQPETAPVIQEPQHTAASATPEDQITHSLELYEDALSGLEKTHPETTADMHKALHERLSQSDAALERIKLEEQIFLDAINCEMRH